MPNFVNNWLREITLEQGATSCPLDLPDGEYRLTLADAAAGATRWEIVDATVASGVATLVRAREGTTAQLWSMGSVIYCGLTAATLAALSSGGSGGDNTVVEVINNAAHRMFFGRPSASPNQIGQRCIQIDQNGTACEWVAHSFNGSLKWTRIVLPLADWGTTLPATYTETLGAADRAYAASKSWSDDEPSVTTLQIPALVPGDVDDTLEHAPIPLVFANRSSYTWTVLIDPVLFWEAGGYAGIEAEGFEALGIAVGQQGPDDSVVALTIPAEKTVWIDLAATGGTDQEGRWLIYQLQVRPLSLFA